MKRIAIALVGLCLLATGANSFWQSRQQVSIGGAPPAYTGPGDVAGWSGAYGYWGLRCYNAAYAGNVADVWDKATGTTTHTLLTCSAGGTVNQTINSLATTCAVACVVKQLYDQVGSQQLTVPGGLNPPDLVLNIVGGLPAMFFDGSATSTLLTSTSVATTQAQPLTVAGIIRFNTNTGPRAPFTDGSFAFDPLVTLGAGSITQSFGGSNATYTNVADNIFASLISVANSNVSNLSSMSVNGTITTAASLATDPGPNGISGAAKVTMGAATDSGAAFFLGYVYEIIIKAGAVSTTDQASMTANQRAIGTGF